MRKDNTLTAGEFDQNDAGKNKGMGVLYPFAQLFMDKGGQIQKEGNHA